MQDAYPSQRVKDVFRDTYQSKWPYLQSAYDNSWTSLEEAVSDVSAVGMDLGFKSLSTDDFMKYIKQMTDYERQRSRKLIKEQAKVPRKYPFTELLSRNFRKHKRTIKP